MSDRRSIMDVVVSGIEMGLRNDIASRIIRPDMSKKRNLEIAEGLSVHWDDCDADERKFWVHIKLPALDAARPNDGLMKFVKRYLRRQIGGAIRMVDRTSPYELTARLAEAPRIAYERRVIGSGLTQREFKSYTSDSWVYVMEFWG